MRALARILLAHGLLAGPCVLFFGATPSTAFAADTTEQARHAPAAIVLPPEEDQALEVDATAKSGILAVGETRTTLRFTVKNVSREDVVINQVRTSCGCTVARLPQRPWRLAPGESGPIVIEVDVQGKSGVLVKTATIDTQTGFKILTLRVQIPEPLDAPSREANMRTAAANRQAVFQGDCARCHAAPTNGLTGEALFVAACAICHDAEHRASMVTDLRARAGADAAFWLQAIAEGKAGTLMPAFAQGQGGPLTEAQIGSLAEYLQRAFPTPASR